MPTSIVLQKSMDSFNIFIVYFLHILLINLCMITYTVIAVVKIESNASNLNIL